MAIDPWTDIHHGSSGYWPEGEKRSYEPESVDAMRRHHQGAAAYLEGKSIKDCPLEKHSMEAVDWEQGWEDCQSSSDTSGYVARLADTLKQAEASQNDTEPLASTSRRVGRRTSRHGAHTSAAEDLEEEGPSPCL